MDTPGESAAQQKKFHGGGEEWLAKAEEAQPMDPLVKPDQVAGLAAYLLSPESGVITGAISIMTSGWQAPIRRSVCPVAAHHAAGKNGP